MSEINLIKEDVSISPINDTECEHCGATASHSVFLDLRGNGGGICIGHFCETCATEAAKRLQSTLPSESESEEIQQLRQDLDTLRSENQKLKTVLNWYASSLRSEDRLSDNGDKAAEALGR